MKQVTISSKNQITLPSSLLRARKIAPGQKLYILEKNGEITLTLRTPLERFLQKAQAVRAEKQKPKLLDPLKERQKLREDWKLNEQNRTT